MTTIEIPELCVVALVGASGSGKSTFAAQHFLQTEVLSSDFFRGLVGDDENDLAATGDAFDSLYYVAAKRLRGRCLTVVDATNVQKPDRKQIVQLARDNDCLAVAIVFDLPEQLCAERNESRIDRQIPRRAIARQVRNLRRSLRHLRKEGFRYVFVLNTPEDVASAEITRQPLWVDRRDDVGPFDIIGDVHGCFDELVELLEKLDYSVDRSTLAVNPPIGRKAVFLGDLVDRGPDTPSVVRLVQGMVEAGTALCVAGNHENKLVRKLSGRDVQMTHGLPETMEQLSSEPDDYVQSVRTFLDGLISHYVLDGGKLVVAHAGLPADYHGRASGRVRNFALYGETTGETDEFGLPVRYDWASDYRGDAMVVYGHTPVPTADWVNRTICIDTGCVFGGQLTALRYPEKELVSVDAAEVYYEPIRPLDSQLERGDLLDITDVTGKRFVETSLGGRVTIPEENSAAALEIMSRFAADPHWIIHLPPTMSPSETSEREGFLEHPTEAFDYYAKRGVERVVCEAKHMGSRAIVIATRNPGTAASRFRAEDGATGAVLTRTGRPFFDTTAATEEVLAEIRTAVTAAGLWDELETDWLCLDAEIMPWNAKGAGLVRGQYAPVGSAAQVMFAHTNEALRQAAGRLDVEDLSVRYLRRTKAADAYVDAYSNYCWEVSGLDDLRIAPFQLLASEGRTYFDQDHVWHMKTLGRLALEGGLLTATPFLELDPADQSARAEAVSWWEAMTADGGEGMVVKPKHPVTRDRKGHLVQPGIKCRGREYLRIIYGIDYDALEAIEALRNRDLRRKRAMARREFVLGVEALERFVRAEPLYRVHEAVFGVLAIESEPVDPRL
ncbi:MAG: polynucleotide kinase-phosphatase [bacterium]|nr:polynucleotide kinase-phosphatase [bacterium]